MTEDDPTKPAGEHPHEPAVPVIGPEPAVPVVGPEHDEPQAPPARRPRLPKRWVPLAAITAAAAIALAIALPLTLGGSSSSVTPPPSATVQGTLSGSFLTTTVQDQRLIFATLVETATQVSGSLTVTTSGPAHKRLLARLYTVTGTVAGSVLHLTLTPASGTAATLTFTATYASGTITATIGTGEAITLERGTLASYRQLVRKDRATLLS